MKKKLESFSVRASDIISSFVATWTFIFLYTFSMILWIILHVMGILHIDSFDFIKWNLFLSWFAGIQASIVMMSSDRQAEIDRKKIRQLLDQVDMLEEILNDYLDEQEEKQNEQRGSKEQGEKE